MLVVMLSAVISETVKLVILAELVVRSDTVSKEVLKTLVVI